MNKITMLHLPVKKFERRLEDQSDQISDSLKMILFGEVNALVAKAPK